jgi:hypothetical protein
MKILKIKVGEVYIDGKTHAVYNTAFPETSKDGKTVYYKITNTVFIQEIKDPVKTEKIKVEL